MNCRAAFRPAAMHTGHRYIGGDMVTGGEAAAATRIWEDGASSTMMRVKLD